MTSSPTMAQPQVAPFEWMTMLAVSVVMIGLSCFHGWSLGMTDTLGFVTGGVCVWLVVREHVANWPIGLANNLIFFLLFLQARIYADMTLQIVYFGLGVFGWWEWVKGGPNHKPLTISLVRRREWIGLICFIPLATWLMDVVLIKVNDAVPFWDSLTTVLSLAAQFLLCLKRLENWFFWIAADIIYVPHIRCRWEILPTSSRAQTANRYRYFSIGQGHGDSLR